ncbi:hypothetical protein C0J50_15644 [Silurus asotus]|uniref:Uncharacterized protein n=1 Tax=Silurus asotus TaxID=30991 RepID=A0AAD5FQQ4_SILAS|nr:hypothetical protein C0J50_15644 [Silurus asotus]
MADANSDTQVLLQSMLQRLRLQPKLENNSLHTQDIVAHSIPVIEQNGSATTSTPQTLPMYNLGFSMDSKSCVTNLAGPLSSGSTGITTSFSNELAKGIAVHSTERTFTPNLPLKLGFMSNHTASRGSSDISTRADDGTMTKQRRKQIFSLTKMKNVPSQQTVAHSDQSESNIQIQKAGEKRWTQKVKEKWKERHKNIPRIAQGDGEKQEQNKMTDNIRSPIPVQSLPGENNTTSPFNKDNSVQLQPISNGFVEGIPSPVDNMSETLFSPGTFNLMEEIFTGQEWAKFLPSSTSSQSACSITQDQEMGLTSSISQSHQNDQTMHSQWNYRDCTGPSLPLTQSQVNSELRVNIMDATEVMLNQANTSSFGLPLMSELNGQHGLSDSGVNQLESMDLSGSRMGNNHSNNDQVHIYSHNQSSVIELNANSTLSNEQSVNQSQATEINHNQPGGVHEVLSILDLSYLQPNDSSSLRKQMSLSRKRGYSTERKNSETGEMQESRHNCFVSGPPEGLSPASSTSSLQYSISQDSESSVSIETVIKKRRVENTRRVRFAEKVTIVPMLALSDNEDDPDDEDYTHNANQGTEDKVEDSPPQASAPRWIEALRSKKKRMHKLKLPRMRTRKYRFV